MSEENNEKTQDSVLQDSVPVKIIRRKFLFFTAVVIGVTMLEIYDSLKPKGITIEIKPLSQEFKSYIYQYFSDEYLNLKQNFLVETASKSLRTIYDPSKMNTDAEVQAYSMLDAAAVGDEETFGRLWDYQKNYRNKQGTISWLMDSNGDVVSDVSAFDSTQDTAASLIIAHRKGWKGSFADDAKSLLQSSMENEIDPVNFVPKAGNYEKGSSFTNPSYYDPFAYEQLFADYDKRWLKVADACRRVLDNVITRIQLGEIKCYPDWVNPVGQPVSAPDGSLPKIGYDSTRIALRQLQAALHLKGASKNNALMQLKFYNDFYEKLVRQKNPFDIAQIVDGYTLKGKPISTNTYTAFASAAVAASMVSSNLEYRNYMLRQLPDLTSQYPFNEYMFLNILRILSES